MNVAAITDSRVQGTCSKVLISNLKGAVCQKAPTIPSGASIAGRPAKDIISSADVILMRQKTPITIAIFFGLLLHSGLSLAEFEASDMVGVHEVALQIYEACPPSDCLVIGLGQSPTPFVADLSTAAPNYVWNVPLSNFGNEAADGTRSEVKLSGPERSRLFDHLKTFLPPADRRRGKRLLVVDFADTGVSLLSTQRYFQEYMNDEHQDPITRPKVESAAITESGNYLPTLTKNRPDFLFNIPAKAHELNYKIYEQKFDMESEYGSFDLGIRKGPKRAKIDFIPKERKSSEEYLKLVQKIQKLRVELNLKPFSAHHHLQHDPHHHRRTSESKIATTSSSSSSSSSSSLTSRSLKDEVATMMDVVHTATSAAHPTSCKLGQYNGFKSWEENYGENECVRAEKAIEKGKLDTLKDFISNDKKVQICFMNAVERDFPRLFAFILEKRPELFTQLLLLRGNDNYTPVIEAALRGRIEMFKILLKSAIQFAPSSLFFVNDEGDRQTLATAVIIVGSKRPQEVLRIIAREYPDLLFIRNSNGNTPAHLAINGEEDLPALETILDNGPKELLNVKDGAGRDLFKAAIFEGGSDELFEYLEKVRGRH